MLHHYELDDPVLWDVARIVHEADLADDRFDAPEAAGLDVHLSWPVDGPRRRRGPRGHRPVVRRPVRVSAPRADVGTRPGMTRQRLSTDAAVSVAAQALRAFAYGFGSVLLGVTLEHAGLLARPRPGWCSRPSLPGPSLASLLVGRYADRVGRRRCYVALYLLARGGRCRVRALRRGVAADPRGADGCIVDRGGRVGPVHVARAGDARRRAQRAQARVAASASTTRSRAAAGSLGGARQPAGSRCFATGGRAHPRDERFFLVFVPGRAGRRVGGPLAQPTAVEVSPARRRHTRVGSRARAIAADRGAARRRCSRSTRSAAASSSRRSSPTGSAQRFDASRRHASASCSSPSASCRPRRSSSRRGSRNGSGCCDTMVFTHLPSNVLLMSIAFAPTLAVAVALLLGADRALADGRADPPGLRDGARRPPRNARRGRVHEHRPLRRPTDRPVLAGASAVDRARAAVRASPARSRASTTSSLWRWFSHVPLPEDTRGLTEAS